MFYWARSAVLFGLVMVNLTGCVGYYESKNSAPAAKDLTLALLVVPEQERARWKNDKSEKLAETKPINDDRAFPLKVYPIPSNGPVDTTPVMEVKVYNDQVRWCGRTIWAIIPIPLMSRSCRTFTELTLQDGEPVSAREQYLEKSGRICGPFVPLMEIANGFCADHTGLE